MNHWSLDKWINRRYISESLVAYYLVHRTPDSRLADGREQGPMVANRAGLMTDSRASPYLVRETSEESRVLVANPFLVLRLTSRGGRGCRP